MKNYRLIFSLVIAFMSLYSCNQDDYVSDGDSTDITDHGNSEIEGFYLLNEGSYGTNSASLDYIDLINGKYKTNIYGTANPTIVKELGDVGNDIKIYGSKMYIIITNSNIVEVVDRKTAKHLKTISLDSGRKIQFANGKAYVTSYAPISTNKNSNVGRVVEIDTVNYEITRQVSVGSRPEGLDIVDNKLFVANSVSNDFRVYDKNISVVDIASFIETYKIEIAPNLNQITKDGDGDLYVTSMGNFNDISPNLYVVDSKTYKIKKTFNLPVSKFTIDNNQLYYYSYNYTTKSSTYGLINTKTEEIISPNFIKDPKINDITTPYSINVNPQTKDIYITNSGGGSKGFIYCFNKSGIYKWSKDTGIFPAHIAFLYKSKK